MAYDRLQRASPHLIAGFGGVLLLVAATLHLTELVAAGMTVGPGVALALDGSLALGLVYAGYWLDRTDLSPEGRWQVWVWCLAGAALLTSIVGVSILVRTFEGRVVGEALFPLLVAAEAGGIAGVVAGHQTARARREVRRTQATSDRLRERTRQLQAVLETGQSVETGERFETPEGARTFLTRVTPLFDDGEVYAACGVASDITAEHERTIERQNERLEQFTGVVSHDLRNPLTVAGAQLAIASEEHDSEHLDHARHALDRMEALIDDLLTLARGDETAVDLGTLARRGGRRDARRRRRPAGLRRRGAGAGVREPRAERRGARLHGQPESCGLW